MLEKVEVYSAWDLDSGVPLINDIFSGDLIQLRNIEGLGPVKANIATSQLVSGRGEIFLGKSITKRNLVLTVGLNPDWVENTMSSLRQKLYGYFMTGDWIKLRFFSDDMAPVEICGYVESVDPNIFSKDPEMVISVICPQPDFIEIDATVLTGEPTVDNSVDVELIYPGTVRTGFEVQIVHHAETPAFDMTVAILVKEPTPLQNFAVLDIDLLTDGYFVMNSLIGRRLVQTVNDGVVIDRLRGVGTTSGNTWPELLPGTNLVSIATEFPDEQEWTLTYYARYGGL